MNALFEQAIDEATEAGNKAGTEWLFARISGKYVVNVGSDRIYLTDLQGNKVNPMLDACGGAYINLYDRRTSFARYLKKKHAERQIWSVPINHKFGGWQDMGLKEAVIKAATDVLKNKYGITNTRHYTAKTAKTGNSTSPERRRVGSGYSKRPTWWWRRQYVGS